MTSFDRAWDIAKEDDPDYSKFGEKFARKIMGMKEGAKGLPEGTKFADLTSTSDYLVTDPPYLYSGAGAEKDTRPPMPKGVPIDILDLSNYRPDPDEEENQRILARIMGTKDYDGAVDMIDQMERERMEAEMDRERMAAESAKMRGHVNIPDSLIRRVRDDPTPKDD